MGQFDNIQSLFVDPDENVTVVLQRKPFLNGLVEGWFTSNYIVLTEKRMYVKCKAKATLVANKRSNVFETIFNASQVRNCTLEHANPPLDISKVNLIAIAILIVFTVLFNQVMGGLIGFFWFIFFLWVAFKVVQHTMSKTWLHIEAVGASSGSYYVNAFGYNTQDIDILRKAIARLRE